MDHPPGLSPTIGANDRVVMTQLARVLGVLGMMQAAASCAGSGVTGLPALPLGGHHVLFTGNSLTYENDLPGTLSALASEAGDTIETASVVAANYALIDHYPGGSNALQTIEVGGWEFVVLQQGSDADGLHPSPMGTFLVALTMYERITGHDARAFPAHAIVSGRDLNLAVSTRTAAQPLDPPAKRGALAARIPRA